MNIVDILNFISGLYQNNKAKEYLVSVETQSCFEEHEVSAIVDISIGIYSINFLAEIQESNTQKDTLDLTYDGTNPYRMASVEIYYPSLKNGALYDFDWSHHFFGVNLPEKLTLSENLVDIINKEIYNKTIESI